MCAALNDLEYVWRTVASMPDDLHLETVVSAVEATGEATADQCRADVTSLLDPVFNQYDTYSMLIVGRIAIRVRHFFRLISVPEIPRVYPATIFFSLTPKIFPSLPVPN